MLVAFGLFFYLLFAMGDDSSQTAMAVDWACLGLIWPLWLAELIFGHTAAPIFFFFLALGWVGTGLFWGFIMELLFLARAKMKAHDAVPRAE